MIKTTGEILHLHSSVIIGLDWTNKPGKSTKQVPRTGGSFGSTNYRRGFALGVGMYSNRFLYIP
jgi:hypothetical protein